MNTRLAKFYRKISRRLKERNRRFRRLNLTNQRIKIAKDVIKYLREDKLIARNGIYAKLDVSRISKDHLDLDEQFNVLVEAVPSCEVCGIGGVFIAAVTLNDKLSIREAGEGSGTVAVPHDALMREYLQPWFSDQQLGLIESAFEKASTFAMRHEVSRREAEDAAAFGVQFACPDDRLIAICQNIIKHRGKFVPPKCKV